MSADAVLTESRPAEGVALLRLNRPAVLNALNLALRRALAEAFARLDADDSVRAIVLAGSEVFRFLEQNRASVQAMEAGKERFARVRVRLDALVNIYSYAGRAPVIVVYAATAIAYCGG